MKIAMLLATAKVIAAAETPPPTVGNRASVRLALPR